MQEHLLSVARYPDVSAFLPEVKKFTAVVCSTDYEALKLYQNLKRSVKIPGDLSVIGYDNLDFTELLSPPLTTVNQYKEELGVACVQSLLRLLENHTQVIDRKFNPELILRESVKNKNG